MRDIEELLTRQVGGRLANQSCGTKGLLYQAAAWKTARRVVAKEEGAMSEKSAKRNCDRQRFPIWNAITRFFVPRRSFSLRNRPERLQFEEGGTQVGDPCLEWLGSQSQ